MPLGFDPKSPDGGPCVPGPRDRCRNCDPSWAAIYAGLGLQDLQYSAHPNGPLLGRLQRSRSGGYICAWDGATTRQIDQKTGMHGEETNGPGCEIGQDLFPVAGLTPSTWSMPFWISRRRGCSLAPGNRCFSRRSLSPSPTTSTPQGPLPVLPARLPVHVQPPGTPALGPHDPRSLGRGRRQLRSGTPTEWADFHIFKGKSGRQTSWARRPEEEIWKWEWIILQGPSFSFPSILRHRSDRNTLHRQLACRICPPHSRRVHGIPAGRGAYRPGNRPDVLARRRS